MLCFLLPLVGALPAQTPGQPAKLAISSTPKGAAIFLNGKRMGQPTDATFAVSPGAYKVSVSGGSGNLNCPVKTVTVSAGSTAELSCTAAGWAGK
jgi:hypothetical protein